MDEKPKKKISRLIFASLTLLCSTLSGTISYANTPLCGAEQNLKTCSFNALEANIPKINNTRWRDQSYREFAKLLTSHEKVDIAIQQIEKIDNPDTRALTIRAIAMGVSKLDLNEGGKGAFFQQLHSLADSISIESAREIAKTYLAIAESSANLFDTALETAKSIKTESLRHKSYMEIAEVMAQSKQDDNAFISIQNIESNAFKNKAYASIAKIFVKNNQFDSAMKAISNIDDPYVQTNSLLNVVEAHD